MQLADRLVFHRLLAVFIARPINKAGIVFEAVTLLGIRMLRTPRQVFTCALFSFCSITYNSRWRMMLFLLRVPCKFYYILKIGHVFSSTTYDMNNCITENFIYCCIGIVHFLYQLEKLL